MNIESTRGTSLRTKDAVKKAKLWLGTYLLLSAGCVVVYVLLRLHVFDLLGRYRDILQKISLGAACMFVVLLLSKLAERALLKHGHTMAAKYNFLRLIRLLAVVIIILIFVSFLFENWYTAAVSLGLISLILGFALQTPISSFIGWIYILTRSPYKVGDRIQLDTFHGDVVEIDYLDTTLWEFGGDYLSSDLPTGRLIRFPNSLVFSTAVYNYSWQKFPYIWNELPFHIAYESDFDFVITTIRRIAKTVLGPDLEDDVENLKNYLSQTPVDELEVKEYPYLTLRTNPNTWVEITLVYLVDPKTSSAMRTALLKAVVHELLKSPDKVKFPNGNNR